MRKYIQPSVSDSFNSPNNKLPNPANIYNWESILLQFCLVIAGAVTFATIIHFSNKSIIRRIQDVNDEKLLSSFNSLAQKFHELELMQKQLSNIDNTKPPIEPPSQV